MTTIRYDQALKLRNGADVLAVANFVGSMGGKVSTRHEAYENARSDAQTYGWSDATLGTIIDAIAGASPTQFIGG